MSLLGKLIRTVTLFGAGVAIGYAVTKAWVEGAPS